MQTKKLEHVACIYTTGSHVLYTSLYPAAFYLSFLFSKYLLPSSSDSHRTSYYIYSTQCIIATLSTGGNDRLRRLLIVADQEAIWSDLSREVAAHYGSLNADRLNNTQRQRERERTKAAAAGAALHRRLYNVYRREGAKRVGVNRTSLLRGGNSIIARHTPKCE